MDIFGKYSVEPTLIEWASAVIGLVLSRCVNSVARGEFRFVLSVAVLLGPFKSPVGKCCHPEISWPSTPKQ